jgi:hypothetical protein
MSAAQTAEPGEDKELRDTEKLKTSIRAHVLRALGEPGVKSRVQVRPLWGAYYRVNIVVEEGPGCVTIPRSYFLKTDVAGAILESTPKLTKPD